MKTILVVTRDDHIARALVELVRTVVSEVYPGPVKVLLACTPDDVLDIVSREHPDVLLTDHYLAGMTGLELVRWLATALRGSVMILMTSDSRMLADPWKFAGPDVNEVLARPLGRESLKHALTRWLGTPPREAQPAVPSLGERPQPDHADPGSSR